MPGRIARSYPSAHASRGIAQVYPYLGSGARRTGVGYPYRVYQSYGYLTGGDTNPDFDGRDKYARFREMWQRDGEVAGTLALIEWPYLSSVWGLEGGDDDIREWLAGVAFSPSHEDALDWRELLQHILYYRRYGNYIFERVPYKTADGYVATYLSPRPPESVYFNGWYLKGLRLAAIDQEYYTELGRLEVVRIDADRLLHFVWGQEANNVEGESILRSCYGDYVSKRECRDIRNIGVERAIGALKLVRKQDGQGNYVAPRDGEADDAETTVRDFMAHEQTWVRESDAYGVEFLQTVSEGIKEAQAVIDYSDMTIKRRVLAQFMLHGQLPSGSRAVADTQEGPFWNAMEGDARYIAGKLRNEWLIPMVRLNWGDEAAKECPTLTWSDIRASSPSDVLKPVYDGLSNGGIVPSVPLRRWILEKAGAPIEAIEAVEDDVPPSIPTRPADDGEAGDAIDDDEPAGGAQEHLARFAAELPAYTVDPANPDPRRAIYRRAPVGPERVVSFAAVAREWDTAEAEAMRLVEEFRSRVIADTMERARKAMAANRPLTPDEVSRIREQRKFVTEYARKLSALAFTQMERGERDVVGELKAFVELTGGRGPMRIKFVEPGQRSKGWNPTATEAEVRQLLKSIVTTAISDHAAKLATTAAGEAVGQMAAPVPNLQAVMDRMTALSRGEISGAARNAVSTGYNRGREAAAKYSGAETMTYSAILEDGRTCRACAEQDMRVVTVGTPEHEALVPPYRNCQSTLGGSGNNRCRCMGVYAYSTEETTA